MTSPARHWLAVGAFLGAIGVALGAYSAHGLDDLLRRQGFVADDLARRMDNFETAVRYQTLHALAIMIVGLALEHRANAWWRFAGWAFLVGVLLFSGLLKVLTFTGPDFRWLGRVVPVGGLAMIVGWLALAVGALRRPRAPASV
jgi:uncharacterized membrane protein YgdD (TMEM256/DUF423 family)